MIKKLIYVDQFEIKGDQAGKKSRKREAGKAV